MTSRPPCIMLVAGEASGDRHAAGLFIELKKLIPGVRGIGMGGRHMAEAGVEVRFDSSHIGVIGLTEILRHAGEIRRALGMMRRIVCTERPDLLVCVDYKEFNFTLARKAKRCGVPVLFYISPQIWAWRPGRVKKYGRAIDMMAVIFPFEVPFYEAHHIPVRYVGHPLAEKVHPSISKEAALKRFGLGCETPVVGLFPGSRGNEIRRLLPLMLAAARRLRERNARTQFILAQATSVDDALLEIHLAGTAFPVTVVKEQPYDVMQCCDAAMTASGTATLELALMSVPMVITYRISPFSYLLGRLLVRIPHIGLANIIAGKLVVKEFIQYKATPEALCGEIENILSDRCYTGAMRRELARIKEKLGPGGGSANLARLAAEMLAERRGARSAAKS